MMLDNDYILMISVEDIIVEKHLFIQQIIHDFLH